MLLQLAKGLTREIKTEVPVPLSGEEEQTLDSGYTLTNVRPYGGTVRSTERNRFYVKREAFGCFGQMSGSYKWFLVRSLRLRLLHPTFLCDFLLGGFFAWACSLSGIETMT